jgi:nitrogen fixation NifU-like protein
MSQLDHLDELYEQIVLDHYRNPRNSDPLRDPAVSVEVNNPFCGDEVRLQLARDAEGRVSLVSVSGRGCAISQASGSLMSGLLTGLDATGLTERARVARRMLKGEAITDPEVESLGDMSALAGVRKYPVRVKCALLAWTALEDAAKKLGGAG